MLPDRLMLASGNRLIDSLPKETAKRLLLLEKPRIVEAGEVIYRRNGPTPHVFFPVTAVYAHVVSLKDGQRIAAATVGNEGMLGMHVLLGVNFSPSTAISLIPGTAFRIPVPTLLEAMRGNARVGDLLHRYAAYSLGYAHQSVACNTTHSVEERVCCWLLMIHDRVGKDEFPLTHATLAEMLGIRRQTVSLVARKLRAAGFIAYRRGLLTIVNRRGLERISCECYEVNRTAYHTIVRKGINGAAKFSHRPWPSTA